MEEELVRLSEPVASALGGDTCAEGVGDGERGGGREGEGVAQAGDSATAPRHGCHGVAALVAPLHEQCIVSCTKPDRPA